MPAFQALLIDLDGTLVDSAPEIMLAVNEVRDAFGLAPVSLAVVRGWVGEGVEVLLRRALVPAGDGEVSAGMLREARTEFDEAYRRVLGTRSAAFPGVEPGLARLRAQGVPLACVSNKPEGFARDLLAALDLLAPFTLVVGGDTAATRKPDPAPVFLAAHGLGVAPADCLLVGDSAIDVATARAAGCPVWCLRSGYSRGRPADELGADAVFDRFDQLVDALWRADAAGA